MSLSFQKLEPVEVKMPQMILSNKRDYAVLKGPQQINYKQWFSSSVSNSNITFTMPPPSPDCVIDRRFNLYVPVRLTIVGTSTAGGQFLTSIGHDAPRYFGLSSAIDTLSTTINQTTVTVNLADVVQPLLRFNIDNQLKDHLYSTSFACPDQTQLYSQLAGSTPYIRNPLGGYGDSNDETVSGRGGNVNYVIVSQLCVNGGTGNQPSTASGQLMTTIVDVCFCEPLFCLSPFYWGAKDCSGFTHVNSMDMTVNFLSQAGNRFWSRDETALPVTISYGIGSGSGVSSFANTSGNNPLVLATYYTPRELDLVPRDMPVTYPFFEIQRYVSTVGAIGANTTFNNLPSNSIQLNSIPRKLYVVVRQQNSDLYSSCTNTDSFLQINQINVNYQNINGIFQSSNMLQLYNISRRAGCSLSWSQWSAANQYTGTYANQVQGVGSVFCAEFAVDIPLSNADLNAPGKLDNSMLQVTISGANTSSRPINAAIYLIVVLEGTFCIEGIGRASQAIGVLSSSDIMDAKIKPYLNYDDIREVNGGDFLSGVKQFFGDVNKFLKDNKVISSVLGAFPVTAPFASTVKNLGYGEGVVLDEFGGDGEGVYASGDGVYAAGGRRMSKKAMNREMKKRMML